MSQVVFGFYCPNCSLIIEATWIVKLGISPQIKTYILVVFSLNDALLNSIVSLLHWSYIPGIVGH